VSFKNSFMIINNISLTIMVPCNAETLCKLVALLTYCLSYMYMREPPQAHTYVFLSVLLPVRGYRVYEGAGQAVVLLLPNVVSDQLRQVTVAALYRARLRLRERGKILH